MHICCVNFWHWSQRDIMQYGSYIRCIGLVLLFYILPLGSLYTKCKSYFWYGANTLGDGFFGNQVIYKVMQCCLLIWFSGMLFVGLHYLKKWKKYRWICKKKHSFSGRRISCSFAKAISKKELEKGEILYELYHRFSCVMGIFAM